MMLHKLAAPAFLSLLFVCALRSGTTAETVKHTIESAILAEAGYEPSRLLEVDLPLNYRTSGIRYPVVYLLHGAGSGAYDMAPAGRLAQGLMGTPLIVVRPSLNRRGSGDQTDRRSERLERVLTQEIVPFIDATYRTMATRDGRAVSGFSMGGADAVYIGLGHPELFSQIVSLAAGHSSPGLVWTWARETTATHAYQRQPLGSGSGTAPRTASPKRPDP